MNIAAGDIQVSTNGHEAYECANGMKVMHMVLKRIAPLDHGGWGLCISHGGLFDAVGGNAGDGGHLLRCVCLDMGCQFVKPGGP